MFTKIDIKKFGLFKDFRWPNNLLEFERVNVIYGRNYSGKTTLSRIFDCIAQGTIHKDYLDADFTLYEDGSLPVERPTGVTTGPYQVTHDELSYGGKVRVYNSDYVSRNLSWLRNEETGEIKPFALIGGENVKAQKEIEEIEKELGSVDKKTGLRYEYDTKKKADDQAWKKHNAAEQGLENNLKDKANRDIKANKYYVKQGAYYNVNSFKGDVTTIYGDLDQYNNPDYEWPNAARVALEDGNREILKKIVDEVLKPTIYTLPETEPHLKERRNAVTELVQKRITLTQTLQELIDNDLLQAWVNQGRELNKDREVCAFCGNPIPEKRWKELNAHFSKESEELKANLTELRGQLENASKSLDGFLESKLFTEPNIYVTYVEEYKAVKEKWDKYVEAYKKEIERLIGLIDERLGNIFKPIENITFSGESLELVPILKEINGLIQKNNEYSLKLDGQKDEARNQLRLDEVYRYCEECKYVEEYKRIRKEGADMIIASTLIGDILRRIQDLEQKIKDKELAKKDEGLAAKKITKLLQSHFGNDSLTLEPEEVIEDVKVITANAVTFLPVTEKKEPTKKTRFVVMRGGVPAKNLSDGERSLIAFCYFIAQMEDELKGEDAKKLVIYIDDPISSLDSSHIFFMFSLIDKKIVEPKKYAQIFISTHNLDFLKYLKRLSIPIEYIEHTKTEHWSHYEIIKTCKGANDYKCEIVEMPKHLKEYVTEYNFLFEQIYLIAMPFRGERKRFFENNYTQYYNIGNNMRKFMECYLFYRYPNTDNPIKYLKRLFDDHLPTQVNRVVNEYSHLSFGARGAMAMDVPEIELAARHIMKAVQEKDPEHFKSLCESVGKKSNVTFDV